MRLVLLITLLCIPLLPEAAGAIDVDLGMETTANYDSNVFRDEDEDKGDFSFRFSPTISISSHESKLRTSLSYKPTYEVFTKYTDENDLTHNLGTTLDYMLSNRTNIAFGSNFRSLSVLNFEEDDTIDEGLDVIPNNDTNRDTIHISNTSLTVAHVLAPKWTSNSSFSFGTFDTDRRNSVDSKTIAGSQSFTRALDAWTNVGVGGTITAQLFDEVKTLPASQTFIYQVFGTFSRNFGESTTLSVQAGPAFIVTDQDNASGTTDQQEYPAIEVEEATTVGDLRNRNIPVADDFGQGLTDSTPVPAGSVVVPSADECVNAFLPPVLFDGSRCKFQRLLRNSPVFPDEQAPIPTIDAALTDIMVVGGKSGADDSKFTLFANIALTQRWTPTLSSSLAYNRSESTASGQGTSTIADSVTFLTTWLPSELWDLSFRANYVKRESPTNLARTFAEVESDGTLTTFDLVQLNGLASVVEESTAVDTERWSIYARAARRLTRHITVSMRTQYSDQISDDTSRNPNDFGNFSVTLGFRYDFEPFRF